MEIVLPFVIVAAVIYQIASGVSARSKLDAWAKKKDISVIDCQYSLFGGPFVSVGNTGITFRVTLKNKHGLIRSGWVFLSYPLFSSPDDIELKWDGSPPRVMRDGSNAPADSVDSAAAELDLR